jgi:exodeoxyribonuclease V alpha subunit
MSTFHNSENGFCVLRVKARGQRDLITLVGHAAMISAGEFVQASGSWINDRTHGLQFKASFLKAAAPTTVEGIEKGDSRDHAVPAQQRCRYVARGPHLQDLQR